MINWQTVSQVTLLLLGHINSFLLFLKSSCTGIVLSLLEFCYSASLTQVRERKLTPKGTKPPARCEIWGPHSDGASGVATVEHEYAKARGPQEYAKARGPQEYAKARGPQAHSKNFLTK